MGQTLLETKKRINSISSTYKVTSAMKLVSTVKLKSLMNRMENYRYFADEIMDVFAYVSSNVEDIKSTYFSKERKGKKLYIIITSTLGLCGSYNYNIFDLVDKEINEDDDLLVIGEKGKNHYRGFNNLKTLDVELNDIDKVFEKISEYILKEYNEEKYKEIYLVNTKYKNSITFIPEIIKLLPIGISSNTKNKFHKDCLIEPSKDKVLDELAPLYVKAVLKGRLLESFVSEQASRRNAMENASDNAKDIIDELKLQFNKARQGQITNEIIDIVGAANAQKGDK